MSNNERIICLIFHYRTGARESLNDPPPYKLEELKNKVTLTYQGREMNIL